MNTGLLFFFASGMPSSYRRNAQPSGGPATACDRSDATRSASASSNRFISDSVLDDLIERADEGVGRLVADDACSGDFATLVIEENDARRTEQPEAFEQRLVLGGVLRHVGAQYCDATQTRAHTWIAEGEPIHFLAAHAPVRREIEHHRLVGGGEVAFE